jgi:hypothetical protein
VSNYLCRLSGVKSSCAGLIAAGNLTQWLPVTVTAANRFALLAFGQFRLAAELDAPRLCARDHRRRARINIITTYAELWKKKWDPTSMLFQTILNA